MPYIADADYSSYSICVNGITIQPSKFTNDGVM